jgi:RES domain-containing protein
MVSLDIGMTWLTSSRSALLVAPSVIVPEEFNVLINPRHPGARDITATKVRRWLYDPRLTR